MSTLRNNAAPGDPLARLGVTGFNDMNGAISYIQNGFKAIAPNLPVFETTLSPGGQIEFNEDPWVVFTYLSSNGQLALAAMIQLFGDLPGVAVRSFGSQLLLEALK